MFSVAAMALRGFLMIGLQKTIVEPLATWAMGRTFRSVLPMVFDRLDRECPELMEQGRPLAIDREIQSALYLFLGRTAQDSEIQLIRALYDPLKAAAKRSSNRHD